MARIWRQRLCDALGAHGLDLRPKVGGGRQACIRRGRTHASPAPQLDKDSARKARVHSAAPATAGRARRATNVSWLRLVRCEALHVVTRRYIPRGTLPRDRPRRVRVRARRARAAAEGKGRGGAAQPSREDWGREQVRAGECPHGQPCVPPQPAHARSARRVAPGRAWTAGWVAPGPEPGRASMTNACNTIHMALPATNANRGTDEAEVPAS